MDFSQLKKSLSDKVLPAYCILGEDAFLKGNALKQFKAKVQNPAMNVSVYSQDDGFDPNAVVSELNTMAWGSEYRLVIVQNPKQVGFINDYLTNPNPNSILVIYLEGNTLPKGLTSDIEKVYCTKLEMVYINRYVVQMGKELDTEIEPEACKILVEYMDGNMQDIVNEAEKLFGLAMGGIVTREMIVQNVTPKTEYLIFDLSDAVLTRNFDKTFVLLKDLKRKSTDSFSILATLSTAFRRLLHFALHLEDDSVEVASQLGVKQSALYHIKEKLKYYTLIELFKIVDILSEAEYKAKSGQTNINTLIEALIWQIMTSIEPI